MLGIDVLIRDTTKREKVMLGLVFLLYLLWLMTFRYVNNYVLACAKRCQEMCPVSIDEYNLTWRDTALPFTYIPNVTTTTMWVNPVTGKTVPTDYEVVFE